MEKLHFQLHFPGSPWEAKVKERRPIQLEYHNQIFTTIEWVDDAKEGGGKGSSREMMMMQKKEGTRGGSREMMMMQKREEKGEAAGR